jgi:CelD/BcsL family acetyltransferase involved in cellulose biosynthesis
MGNLTEIQQIRRINPLNKIEQTDVKSIQWLSSDEYGEWDDFVTEHPRGLVYHLSDWQRWLEIAFEHIRGRFLVLRDRNGKIQAGLPVYTVKSWLLGNRLVSVPFATICDPLISTKEEFSLLWPAIEAAPVKHRNRKIVIRIRHTNIDTLPAPLKASVKYKHHYLPLNKSLDELFHSFNKSNVCRAVNKAKREGVVVVEKQDEQSLRIFHSFLASMRRNRSLPPIPLTFFQEMYRSLSPDRIALYLAIQAGHPVGGILVSKFKNMWTSEYSADARNSTRGISPLIYWETIQRAKNSGATIFSFGRTSLDNIGLLIHKRRWATIEEELIEYVSPANVMSVQHNEFFKSAMRLFIRYAPNMVQKFIGDFSYRHLG